MEKVLETPWCYYTEQACGVLSIVERWKEHSEELLIPVDIPEEAIPKISGVSQSISIAEDTIMGGNLYSGK